VGFAPRRDAEQLPEGACHAAIMQKKRGAVNAACVAALVKAR